VIILRIEQLLAYAIAVFLAADVALIFFAVLARYLLNSPIGWSEEIARLFLACFTFLGMALAFRRGQHLAIFAFVNLLSSRAQHVVAVTRNVLIAAFSLGFAWVGLGVAIHRWDQLTPALGFSEGWSVVPMVIGLFLMATFALLNIRRTPTRLAIATSACIFTLAALLVLTLKSWLPFAQQLHPLVIIVPVYLAAMAAGLPLGFDIVFAAVGYLLIADAIPISIVAQRMHEGVNHFVLIAVPFFVLAGAIMEKGGISGRLVAVAHTLIGHVRGGLGQVTILSMILFSGVSGSKTADISAVGSSLLPQMRKHGTNPNEAVAVLSSSAAMAESIPPSLALIVLGSISSLSVIALFMAGIVPALVIAACLMVLVYLRARRGGAVAEPRQPFSVVMRALYRAGSAWPCQFFCSPPCAWA
jgi:TRAP-type C4-dicarboxylate transport system permease small subunit